MAICKQITIEEPLVVTDLVLSIDEANGLVQAAVTITGGGTGTLKMTWSDIQTETISGVSAGLNNIGYALASFVPGTHTICAEMV